MLLIDCPWCGPRHQSEFTNGGEAHVSRPENPDALTDAAWARCLYIRANPEGVFRERWLHAFGCRRWFNAVRHTATDMIWATCRIGDPAPQPPDGWDGIRDGRAQCCSGHSGRVRRDCP